MLEIIVESIVVKLFPYVFSQKCLRLDPSPILS